MRFNPSDIDLTEVEDPGADATHDPTVDAASSDLAAQFRTAFRGYPAGVAIVTASRPAGPVGILVSSLTSVSATPPIVGLSISDSSNAGQALLQSDDVTVWMLTRDDVELARHFSRRHRAPGEDDQYWGDEVGGRPMLAAHGAALHGRIIDRARAGSATLIVVAVDRIELPADTDEHPGGLVHYDRHLHVVQRPEQLR